MLQSSSIMGVLPIVIFVEPVIQYLDNYVLMV